MTQRGYAAALFCLFVMACGNSEPELPVGAIRLNSQFDADFTLIDQNGTAASDERFEGKPMLLYYGFTTCPDVCPAALGNMTATLDRLGRDAQRVHPLFITVDPERDTPARLSEHLAYDPRILGLTGSLDATEHARNAINLYARKVPLEGSALEYTVDHQSLFYITDRTGQPVYALKDTTPPDTIAALVRRQF